MNIDDKYAGMQTKCIQCQAAVAIPNKNTSPLEDACDDIPADEETLDTLAAHASVHNPAPATIEQTSNLSDVLAFRSFIAPTLIKILFWVWVVGGVVCWLISVVIAFKNGYKEVYSGYNLRGYNLGSTTEFDATAGIVTFSAGLVLLPIYILVVRLWCEMLIVIFRLYEETRDIHTLLGERNSENVL